MTRENNSRKAAKKMKHILISVATMIKVANGMVNPFNLKLQGFSQNMMLTVLDYDDSLEELHHKWSGRTYFDPEMTIMLTFVSSAIFQHAGNVASAPQQQTAGTKHQKKTPRKGHVICSWDVLQHDAQAQTQYTHGSHGIGSKEHASICARTGDARIYRPGS